jgi:hypothetical protein
MNRKRTALGIGVIAAVLALSLTAFAALHVSVLPATAVVSLATPASVTFDGFCNYTCNVTWVLVLSNANVGSIDNTSGPQTTFTPGTSTGMAHLIASDGQGQMALATISVQ